MRMYVGGFSIKEQHAVTSGFPHDSGFTYLCKILKEGVERRKH